jgi:hypothetical protein
MTAWIALLVFIGYLDACSKCSDKPILTYGNWAAAVVLIPALITGGLLELIYLDEPYIFLPLRVLLGTNQ